MSRSTLPRTRSISLGLALTPLGAVAISSVASASPFLDALKGLVASDTGPADIDLAEGPATDALSPEGCDPSGCNAYFYFERMRRDSDLWPGTHQVSYMRVRNMGPAVLANTVLRIDTGLGAVIDSAPGCAHLGPSRVDCSLGTIAANTSGGTSIAVRPTSVHYQIEAELTTTTPHTSTASWFWSEGVSPNDFVTRFSNVDHAACPLIEASVVTTDSYGEITDQGGLPEGRVTEDGRFVPSIQESGHDAPLSIGIVLDDGAALTAADWQALRERVSTFINEWQTWAAAQGLPMPAVGLYTMGPAARRLSWSTDTLAIDAALQSISRGERAASLHATLDLVATDLAPRAGRHVALIVAASTDADGAVGQDALVERLNALQVNAYAVAIAPKAQPLLRELANGTAGFAQTPGSLDGLGPALARVSRDLRGASRYSWLTPFQDATYRDVDISWSGWWTEPQRRGYAPTAATCATDCAVTRALPGRHSSSNELPVTLTINPAAFAAPATLTETVPPPWTPQAITHGGEWDATSRSIVWSFAQTPVPASVGYSLTVNSWTTTSRLRLMGQFKDGSGAHRTCGESESNALPPHPADLNYANSLGPESERYAINGYAKAWRYGSQWIRGQQQIPMAHVTRGMQIARLGGAYDRVDEVVPWQPVATIPPAGPRSSQRSISYGAGNASVTIALDPGTASSAHAVEEVIPPGWDVTLITVNGQFDPVARIIRWGPYEGDAPNDLFYTLVAIDADAGELTGRFSVDGVDTPIGGDTILGEVSDALFENGFD